MAMSMSEAFKSAGLAPEEFKPPLKMARDVPVILPFEKQWDVFGGYDSVSQKSFDDMNFLLGTWQPIDAEELNSYSVRYGNKIRNVLLQHVDKLREFEIDPPNFGHCCLSFYVNYFPVIETLEVPYLSCATYAQWCKELGQVPHVFSEISFSGDADVMRAFEHYCEMSEFIPVRYVVNDQMRHHLDRPYKFKEIIADDGLAALLSDYLRDLEYQPNLNKWYMVCHKTRRYTYEDIYYLKKATDEEIQRVLQTR